MLLVVLRGLGVRVSDVGVVDGRILLVSESSGGVNG
jgi:hypothetical protein